MTDYRAELQRLVQAYDEHHGIGRHHDRALFRAVKAARAALAQPEPVASEVRASIVELQVGVEFLDNEGLVVIASYLRRAIALLQRLSTSTNQEESE
jgi:hypothetical protein